MNNQSQESSPINCQSLRKMLNDISAQLSVPYLQKRSSTKTHKQSLVEELQDSIHYITEKEKELQVALEISKYLLDSNEFLQNKVEKLKENQELLCKENQDLVKDIQCLEQQLQNSANKCEKSLNSEISQNFSHFSLREFTGGRKKDEESLDELFESKAVLQEEVIVLKSKKKIGKIQEVLKKNQRLIADKERLERSLDSAKDQNSILSSRYKVTVQKLKEAEKMQKILIKTNEKLKKKCREAKTIVEKCKDKIEKLEENAKFSDVGQVTKASEDIPEQSLLYELQRIPNFGSNLSLDLSDDEVFQLSSQQYLTPNGRLTYSPNINKKFFGSLKICYLEPVEVQSKRCFKSSIEEYFVMATQAVKMSSPHMDRIGIVPPSFLYQKALEEQVPFHQWHLWIEKQLNFEYIQSIYKKAPSQSRFLNFFKKFN